MKKAIMMVGGIGAGVLLVMAMFSTVVCAQTAKATINDIVSDIQSKKMLSEKIQLLQQIKKLVTNEDWYPGYIIDFIIFLLVVIIIRLIGTPIPPV